MTEQLSTAEAARLCAIAGAVKAKLAGDAKAALPESSTHLVDSTFRIRGSVSKGASEPESTGESRPSVNLFDRGVMLDVLRRLKVTPQQLRTAVRASIKPIERAGDLSQLGQGVIAQDLAAVIEQAQAELCGRLPAEPWKRPGRAGSVHVTVTLETLDPPPAKETAACRLAA